MTDEIHMDTPVPEEAAPVAAEAPMKLSEEPKISEEKTDAAYRRSIGLPEGHPELAPTPVETHHRPQLLPHPLETEQNPPPRTSWGWGRPARETHEVLAFRDFPWKLVYAGAIAVPATVMYLAGADFSSAWSVIGLAVGTVVAALPVMAAGLVAHSHVVAPKDRVDHSELIEIKDEKMAAKYANKRVPIAPLYEAYFRGDIDIVGDVLEALYRRDKFASMVFTQEHVTFFLGKLIPELMAHSRSQDADQVQEHYNRGNDFYRSFLGEQMVYTSGIFNSPEDTLEQAQYNKLQKVFELIHLKKGERHLDIGCGWGTAVRYAAQNYGSTSHGITLANEQVKWAEDQIARAGVADRATCEVRDYRDLPPSKKYNKITCLEMAEHVGIKRFGSFLRQVYDLLEDDGVFYLQIAGLRRAWQYEDLMWGVFMGTHVFPGADASCPLGWVINQVEAAGFEVRSSDTVGVHYSATIKCWYDNWVSNEEFITEKYGKTWFRKWAWFLAWSVISPEQGSATCYQIVLHKNTRNYNRKQYIAEHSHYGHASTQSA